MSPCRFKYVFGLAACCQMQKKYSRAIKFYILASILNGKDPAINYYMAECYLNIYDYVSALISLKETIKKIGLNTKYEELKERVTLLKDAIYKRIALQRKN